MNSTSLCFFLAGGLAWGMQEAIDDPVPTPLEGRVDRYDALILRHAQSRRLNPRMVKSIIAAESGFRRGALSPKGARGLMQVLPSTAEEMGVSRQWLGDPESNLRAGTAYLNWLYRTAWQAYGLEGVSFRDGPPWAQRRVLAAYNGGPKLLYSEEWPLQTRRYVRDVMHYYRSSGTALRRYTQPAMRRLTSADKRPLVPAALARYSI